MNSSKDSTSTGLRANFRRVAVYCGSSGNADSAYFDAAHEMGRELANQGIGVVYGGGNVGLMGACADAALDAGGEVIGVIPHKLRDLEIAHTKVTELIEVDSMHARKMVMASLSDAFIAMPGGFGTLDELVEITTWNQLGYHKKPAGLLNVAGYYDLLLSFFDHAGNVGFIRPIHRNLLVSSSSPKELLEAMKNQDLPDLRQWLTRP